jgi:tetratricopeptide (TPR) repeat protein
MVATHLNNLAQLLYAANRLAEAEPLMRRALAINEKSYGPEHSDVAIDLNNLARLLQATNRLAEAEPLMRRMVVIFLKFTRATSHEHPHLRAAIGNYQQLLKAQRLKPAQITQRLAALGPEAGYDAENWRRLQGQLGQ